MEEELKGIFSLCCDRVEQTTQSVKRAINRPKMSQSVLPSTMIAHPDAEYVQAACEITFQHSSERLRPRRHLEAVRYPFFGGP